jgi:type IV pilus assembly protein PilB
MAEENFTFQRTNRLGPQLVQAGLITDVQLDRARELQAQKRRDLGHVLIEEGWTSEESLLKLVAKLLKIPYLSVSTYQIDEEAVKLLPIQHAERYHAIPLFLLENSLSIAMADPLNILAIDEMRVAVGKEIRVFLASGIEIDRAIQQYYRLEHIAEGGTDLEILQQGVEEETEEGLDGENLQKLASGEQTVATVNAILSNAYLEQASDVHIEPSEVGVSVRYRVDGVLEEKETFPRSLYFPLVSRLKILGGIDIAERRRPQDGRLRIRLRGVPVDIRLSTYPTTNGEKVAIRFLSSDRLKGLDKLGFSPSEYENIRQIIKRPYGILLVTGPTGSGKTTTLYGALQEVDRRAKNVVSIEDPVENEVPGVNQAQVNVRAGLTFASALRSILRQDPDVIMIGEIRDQETADIAVRAALTGHLVLSTLHTNTGLGAVNRLIDLDVEPYLLASSLLGTVAQRLVRKICPYCKTTRPLSEEEKRFLDMHGKTGFEESVYGQGCRRCRKSGFAGRIGVFEIALVDKEIREAIHARKSEEELYSIFFRVGGVSLLDKAVEKAREGVTTLEEAIRVSVN